MMTRPLGAACKCLYGFNISSVLNVCLCESAGEGGGEVLRGSFPLIVMIMKEGFVSFI